VDIACKVMEMIGMLEPNCDMPWNIYLDWLQDQGNEDLRGIDYANLFTSYKFMTMVHRNDEGLIGYGAPLGDDGDGFDMWGSCGFGDGNTHSRSMEILIKSVGVSAYQGDGT
jgi:hypothetical protein